MDETRKSKPVKYMFIEGLISFFLPLIYMFRFLDAHVERSNAEAERIRKNIMTWYDKK